MIELGFELTGKQNETIRQRCLGKREGVASTKDMRDLIGSEAGVRLAMLGYTEINMEPNGRVRVTLDDITIKTVEWDGGDDPTMSRDDNRAALREFIASMKLDAWEMKDFASDSEKEARLAEHARHCARMVKVFDRVAHNMGPQPAILDTLPAKNADFYLTREVVKGDTIRLTEYVPLNPLVHGKEFGQRTITAEVVDEDIKGHGYRGLELFVTRSSGDAAHSVGRMTISEEWLNGKNVERRVWKNEKARDALAAATTKRRGGTLKISGVFSQADDTKSRGRSNRSPMQGTASTAEYNLGVG